MPVPQLVPPGLLDQHGLLVALTPALLVASTALAAAVIGDGRGARVLAGIGMGGALLVQALFLLPGGAAAAYTEPLAHGLVRVGYVQTASAVLIAGWTSWWFRPRAGIQQLPLSPAWAWCLRVALALLLPVLALPLTVIGCECDMQVPAGDDPLHPDRSARRRRVVRVAVAALATVAVVLLIGAPGSRQLAWSLSAAALFVAAITGAGGWRIPLWLGGAAMAMPPW